MVTVTHSPFPRTSTPRGDLALFDVDYSGIARAGSILGGAIADFGAAAEAARERDIESQRFDVLTKFSDFESQSDTAFEELKKSTGLNTANFFEQAEAQFDNAKNSFLSEIPAEFQDEFEFRTQEVRRGLIGKAIDFDSKQKGLYYATAIQTELDKTQKGVAVTPEQLEAAKERVRTLIDASGLSAIEKTEQKKLADKALELTALRQIAGTERGKVLAGAGGIAATDLPANASRVLNAIAADESGGRYNIRYDGSPGGSKISSYADHPRTKSPGPAGPSSAAGKYMMIGSTWDAAAKATGVSDFSPASQDKAAWFWANKTAMEQTGKDINALLAEGNVSGLRRALGTQWEAVRTMSDEKFAKLLQADLPMGQDDLLLDPRFASVDYASAQAAINDGFTTADAAYADALKQRKAANEAAINSLKVGLFDGTAGEQQIVELREKGVLSDYNDITAAYKILEDRTGQTDNYRAGMARLESGGLWAKGDEEHAKMANAMYKVDMAQGLESADAAFANSTILPRWQRMNYAAPDMVDGLLAMTRSADLGKAAFAYGLMAQMRGTAPEAFAAQFSADTQSELDLWEARKNYDQPENRVKQIQGRDVDQATRQAQKILRSDAEILYKEKAYSAKTFLNSVDTVFGTEPKVPLAPSAAATLSTEHRTAFMDNYVKYGGDAAAALDATNKQLSRLWGVTEIGGQKQVMRLPPQNAGYEPFHGEYTWIDRQVREQLMLPADRKFMLISGPETEEAIKARAKDPSAPMPGYRVWVFDEWGVPSFARDADGDIISMSFERTKEMQIEEETDFANKAMEANEDTIVSRYLKKSAELRAQSRNLAQPLEMPQELEEQYQEVIRRREARQAAEQAKLKSLYDEVLGDQMQGGN